MSTFTLSQKEEMISIISDMYKEIYGSRPRFLNLRIYSDIELQNLHDQLSNELDKQTSETQERQSKSVTKFQSKVQELINIGANDEETALKWLAQGLNLDFHWGDLPYLFLHEFDIDQTQFGKDLTPKLQKIFKGLS